MAADTGVQREFDEWMITKALGLYLKDNLERMQWLLRLKAETPCGEKLELSRISGFDQNNGNVKGGAELTFKWPGDAGKIGKDEFKEYLGVTPDFRYWEGNPSRHLIIEAKGTPGPIGNRDRDQAIRYFKFLLDSKSEGGVIYFVPEPQNWLGWLTDRARNAGVEDNSQIKWGVLNWKDEILPTISQDLVRVVGETLIKSADLLRQALSLSNPNQAAP